MDYVFHEGDLTKLDSLCAVSRVHLRGNEPWMAGKAGAAAEAPARAVGEGHAVSNIGQALGPLGVNMAEFCKVQRGHCEADPGDASADVAHRLRTDYKFEISVTSHHGFSSRWRAWRKGPLFQGRNSLGVSPSSTYMRSQRSRRRMSTSGSSLWSRCVVPSPPANQDYKLLHEKDERCNHSGVFFFGALAFLRFHLFFFLAPL